MDAAALPTLETEPGADGGLVARLAGEWTLLPLRERFEELGERVAGLVRAGTQDWDLRGLSRLDNAGALLLWQAWGRQQPTRLAWLPEHESLFAQLSVPGLPRVRRRRMPEGLARLGPQLLALLDHLLDATRLLGQLALDGLQLARQPSLIAWRDISAHVYRTGAQALGITALVGFLVGVTLSYLTSRQLQNFGADIFVVNILGISVWRELGPLLAAILVAGRSGSAMTAQLGVMRVTQELDALSVMGISHTIRLVIPKLLALAVSLPLIVVWTSCMILLGGMVAAQATLGLEYVQFLQGLPAAVPAANLWLGLSKAVVFGLLIAFVACHFGLRIRPNSISLGAGTTDAVVSSITIVIIVDAIFAVAFSSVGL
ncbi:ABC transporter permease [Roseateles violae]|uniref:ABC transporter permease n=1 Tax=Roseateles violae TaxID=3058042 RepID=A0ABT8DZH8_9BURK|nr:ABC transporter permease [Pelomonas sp. PFR6]MDN3922963.1 ABC transporter permease [Pelomonas sp. PFR6]